MGANRNRNPLSTGGISINPARRINIIEQVPNNMLGTVEYPTNNLELTNQSVATSISPLIPVADTSAATVSTTETNTEIRAPQLSPLIALAGSLTPVIIPAIINFPKASIVKQLTEKDYLEQTLNLDTFTFSNGSVVLDTSKIRCDIVSLIPFRSIYEKNSKILSTFGKYFENLYQTSVVRDTTRKYLIVNGIGREYDNFWGRTYVNGRLPSIISKISNQLNSDIGSSEQTIRTLDNLIFRIKEINSCLEIKQNLGGNGPSPFISPNLGLRQFFTSRMLFSDISFNIFSDTKVAYQLLSDLYGILTKCSFNLIEGFTDQDRSTYISNPITIKKQTAQDAITIDSTYGNNLAYKPDILRLRYITNTINMNGLYSSLPNGSINRFKFIINLLSREYKVSKGLGKYKRELNTDLSYFSIQDRGDPFDNILGRVPSDIFLEPAGENSLASLFYIKIGGNNAVVLPFENRQVVGDNETVFIPGTNYFCDSILKGDFSVFFNYKDAFGTRIAKTFNIFNRLLTFQSVIDPTSGPLETDYILRNLLDKYKMSQDFIKRNNNDSTTLITFILMIAGSGNPNIKFEVFKLLLLIILFDSRKNVIANVAQIDRFRDLLFNELSQNDFQNNSNLPLTESNIPNLLSLQIEIVKNLINNSISPLSIQNTDNNGLEKSEKNANSLLQEKSVYNIPVASKFNSDLKSTSNNSAVVQFQQFSRLEEALRGEQNLLKNIVDVAKELFAACNENDVAYHLLDNGSATRFNGLTITGTLFLIYELFSSLVEQFAKPNLTYNIIDGDGGKNNNNQYIQITFTGNQLGNISNSIDQFLRSLPYENDIIADCSAKLQEERNVITNILAFFDQLNRKLSNITLISEEEVKIIQELNTLNPATISSTRTSKSLLRSFVDKKTIYNPTNNSSANFYMPSGKILTHKNYEALKVALSNGELTSGRRKTVVVGIPRDFTKTALAAQLKKDDTYQGNLEIQPTDIIQISIHKIDKQDEGIIYKPKTFKFDLSLFPRGFDSYNINLIKQLNYSSLIEYFEFYDFDEDIPYSRVTPNRVGNYLQSDPYYRTSSERTSLGREVIYNLQQSYLLDLYNHIITGLNFGEESFIEYSQQEAKSFTDAMISLRTSNPNYTGIKPMSPVYKDLLTFFATNSDDLKLMLTLCNDVKKTVFRQKMYDRVFTLSFDADQFEIDENEMMQVDETKNLLNSLRSKNMVITNRDANNDVTSNVVMYKKPNELILDQYFIEVELIQ